MKKLKELGRSFHNYMLDLKFNGYEVWVLTLIGSIINDLMR